MTLVALAVQGVLGVLWLSSNATAIPKYHDSTMYVARAERQALLPEELVVGYPQRNTQPGYPLLIRMAQRVCARHFETTVYVVQLLLAAAGGVYFAAVSRAALFPGLCSSRSARAAWNGVVLATMLATPLLLHFHLALMPDSPTLSLGIILLTATAALLTRFPRPSLHAAAFTASLVCLALLRSERLSFAIATVLLTFLVWPWTQAKPRAPAWRGVGRTLLLLTASALLAVGAVRAARPVDHGEHPFPNIPLRVFECSAFGRLATIHPYLPRDIQDRISLDDARRYDSLRPNRKNLFLFPRLAGKADPGDVTWAEITPLLERISRVAIERHRGAILAGVAVRFAAYLFAPFTFTGEWLATELPDNNTRWTISRMAMRSPTLTRVLVWSGEIHLLLLAILCIASMPRARRGVVPFFLPFIAGVLVNSAGFSLFWPAGWFLRYSLISMIAIRLLMLTVVATGLAAESRRDAG